jgi:O-antigen biosynthesis protein
MTLTVIVPVFEAFAAVKRCLDSALAARNDATAEYMVIDDASVDPSLLAYLDGLADAGQITLVRQVTNSGFVSSVNHGMQVRPVGNVILLNSDTEVPDYWLDRLLAAAASDLRCGTVTPFSNNATICSFPQFCAVNALPPGWSLNELDGVFRVVNAGKRAMIPTAVGFCMLITAKCRKVVGLFDEAHFGRGYGEENDFCMRAAALGFSHLLCADLFVFHEGEASFGSERAARASAAQRAMAQLHPDYANQVAAFFHADPVQSLRQSVLTAMQYGVAHAARGAGFPNA